MLMVNVFSLFVVVIFLFVNERIEVIVLECNVILVFVVIVLMIRVLLRFLNISVLLIGLF